MATFDFKNYQDIFASRLSSLISSAGMSPKDFIVDSGIPDATIYRYLESDRVPKIDDIIRIAVYFDVSVDWLLGLTGDMHERWAQSTIDVAQRYTLASPDDRRVVETVLAKYKGIKE
jgi:transcriptional regulator with XRE-family HTH domain